MVSIGNVPEINKVKQHLEQMRMEGIIAQWELPYENLLTRLSAAIFFITPVSLETSERLWDQLSKYKGCRHVENIEKVLSNMEYRVEFG